MSRKRSANVDDSTVEVASTSSSKRSRVSRNKRNAPLDSSSDEEEGQKRVRPSQTLNSTATDPELYRSGKILRMHLVNFMSHSNMSITFNPRVTFIIGANGSGKSAIQAALMVVLGARARQTSRASSVKEYVKRGEAWAEIEVVLANVGGRPFEPEVYGPEIVIKRKICASGSSTYTIKGAYGNVVSKSTNELNRLLDALDVQVDNPVFVLNQDMARVFLKELEPEKSFALFHKATKLDLVLDTATKSKNELPKQANSIIRDEKKKDILTKEIAALREQLNRLLGLAALKESLSNKEKELLWAKVNKFEAEMERNQKELNKIKQTREKMVEFIKNKDKTKAALMEKASEFDSQVELKNAIFAQASNEIQQLKSKQRKDEEMRSELNYTVSKYQKCIQEKKKDIAELQMALNENYGSTSEHIQHLRNQNEEKKQAILDQRQEHTAITTNVTNDVRMLQDTKQRVDEEISENRLQLSNAKNRLDAINNRIKELTASSKDKLSIYGNQVKMFIADLQSLHKQGQLSEMPIGPIGQYLEVPNPKYRDIVENIIGTNNLQAFIVNSTTDRTRIEAFIKRKYPDFHPFLITARFLKQVYDVRKGCVEPPSGTRLLMGELKCLNPVVMNCLIDRVRIETILISDTKDVAERVTQNRENVPKNLNKVVVPSGMEYFPEPKYRMYSIIVKPARFLQVDVKDRLTQLRAEGNQLTAKVEAVHDVLEGLFKQQQTHVKCLNEKTTTLKRYELLMEDLEKKLFEIDNYDYPEQQDLTVLKKELEEIELFVKKCQDKIPDKEVELERVNCSLKQTNESLRAKEQNLRAIQAEIDMLKKKGDEKRTEVRNLKSNFEIQQRKLGELREKIVQLETTEATASQALAEALSTATAATEQRIDTSSNEEEIRDEIQKLQRAITQCKDANIDPQEIQDELTSKEEARKDLKVELHRMKINARVLEAGIKERFKYLSLTQKHAAVMLHNGFAKIIRTRGYDGQLHVDHKEKSISITVVPRDNHVANATNSTNALSGGERSFSTVCFLLSLWACSEHPFFFLDEYDVFTDEVHRECITRLLLFFAQKHKSQQFIFMTPQAMQLKGDDDVTIVRFHKTGQ